MFHLTILILLSCLRSVAQALLLHIHELYASARNQCCVCLQLAPWIAWSLRRRYFKKEKETLSCRPPSPQLMLSPHLVYFQLPEKYAAWAALSFHNEPFSSKTPPCSLWETWVLVTPHTPDGLDSGLRITSDLCFTSSHYRYYRNFLKIWNKSREQLEWTLLSHYQLQIVPNSRPVFIYCPLTLVISRQITHFISFQPWVL